MDIIEHTFKNWLLLRLLGSSMDKQNWSLAFLFSIERYGFKAFECGLIAPSLIRLWSVDLATFITSAIDRILVRRRKGIFESLLKSIWIHFRPPRFGNLQFTSATKFSSWEALPCCQILWIVLGLVHSSGNLTYAASSQLSILTLLEQFFKDCLTFCIANYLFIYLFIWAVKNLFLTGHSFFIGKIIIEEKRG